MNLVSIIIPVYNVERYLCKCIDSVLRQTYHKWELLLIDDGSTDNSGRICEQYASMDKRIIVKHKTNSGVSETRNIGMDTAKGKYLIFLDSDDYWYDKSALAKLVEIAEINNLDLVRGEYKAVDEQEDDLFIRPISATRLSQSNKVLYSSSFVKYAINDEFFLFLTLIKSCVVKNIRFTKDRIFLEDMLFYSMLCLKKLRCMYVPSIRFYAYRKSNTAVSSMVNPQKLLDSFKMCYEFYKLSKKTQDRPLKYLYQKKSLTIYYSTLETLAYDEYYKNHQIYIDKFRVGDLQKEVCNWMKEYNFRLYRIHFYLNPKWAVKLFRLKIDLVKFKNKIVNK